MKLPPWALSPPPLHSYRFLGTPCTMHSGVQGAALPSTVPSTVRGTQLELALALPNVPLAP